MRFVFFETFKATPFILYSFARSSSMREFALFCRSISFMASPMLPCTLTLPWKKAFWGFSLPLIRSTTSMSLMMKVTSGLSKIESVQN